MNTGRIGGTEKDERSKKVKIPAVLSGVKRIAEGTIKWTKDPDFGYLVASEVPESTMAITSSRRRCTSGREGSTNTTSSSVSTTGPARIPPKRWKALGGDCRGHLAVAPGGLAGCSDAGPAASVIPDHPRAGQRPAEQPARPPALRIVFLIPP